MQAVRPETLITLPHTFATVADVLKHMGLYHNRRLKTFLDLQLKLYSQVNADENRPPLCSHCPSCIPGTPGTVSSQKAACRYSAIS